VTPQRSFAAAPASKPEDRPADNKHLGDAINSAHNPATSSPLQQQQNASGLAGAAHAVGLPASQEELKRQLEEAKATITRLQGEAQESSLRQRKTEAVNKDSKARFTEGTSGMGVQNAPPRGVPVQVVAGLCLLCFLIAYLLF